MPADFTDDDLARALARARYEVRQYHYKNFMFVSVAEGKPWEGSADTEDGTSALLLAAVAALKARLAK